MYGNAAGLQPAALVILRAEGPKDLLFGPQDDSYSASV
jgi:hypothetical protein